MGYLTDGLTFNNLRNANEARQREWPGSERIDVSFRGLEVAGEAGEVANKVKKWLRAQRGIRGKTADIYEIAEEMGDLVVSLDLLAMQLGIDLGQAVKSKFNAVTVENNLRTYIGDDGDWHLKPITEVSASQDQ